MPVKNEKIGSLKYEEAFSELEKIVRALEENQSSLEESISLFERGQELSEHCAALLENADLRLKILNESGLAAADEENFEE